MSNIPPFSAVDEANLISCVLAGPEHAGMFSKLKLEHFYDERHRMIYETLSQIVRDGLEPNPVTLNQALKTSCRMEAAGGLEYVLRLPDVSIGPSFFTDYLRIVQEYAVRRVTIDDARSLANIAQDPAQTPEQIKSHAERLVTIYAQERADETPIIARAVGDFELPPENDPTELIKRRYLCKRGSLLITGPTGVGKSSLLLQMLACFANGIPFLDITPTRMLSSVLIQAENDDGDIAEMRNGIAAGMNLTESQRRNFFGIVRIHTSTGITGKEFCSDVVRPLLAEYKPDFLAIDPALSFLGGDVKEQKDVGNFLRQYLNPEIYTADCACIMSHHTNKPKAGNDDNSPKNGDWAYQGSGSAEWANWARGVLNLQSTGTPGVYKLHGGKRGARLGWRDDKDELTFEKIIVHSREKGVICWDEGDEDSLPDRGGRPKTYYDGDFVKLLGDTGLSTEDWESTAKTELGLSRATFHRAKKDVEVSKQVFRSKINQKWLPSHIVS